MLDCSEADSEIMVEMNRLVSSAILKAVPSSEVVVMMAVVTAFGDGLSTNAE